ncbi:hypothetical protein MON38_01165 [Hymenobacter sp. DH14]|uniref:YD repeat-containing protein n=1 Tax=Hymenobacter cyanobacteriorum TaxID=2926463 RepID=A0A9X1VFN3_9BACT|nr:hypothetical protein [Hymenobacter cyanobacteriorum]MCI1186011.1 hypothetical protein [Hymenobacter cyanobacteriorum]
MKSFPVFCLCVGMSFYSQLATAQTKVAAQHSSSATMRIPVSLPLYATLNKLPQRLSADDSLARLLYARNRVRTVTVLGPETPFGPDTIEHFELDRRGNKIRIDQAHGGQSRLQRFDKHGNFVELVLTAARSFPISTRVVYDPRTKVNTSYVTVGLGEPVLWQQAQEFRKADTASTEAVFKPVIGLETKGASRFLSRSYPTGRDTLRIEFMGFDAADQLIDFSAMYRVQRQKLVVENGFIDFGKLPAQELWRISRTQRGRYVPNTRNVYDRQGRLLQMVNTWEPTPAQKPVSTNNDNATTTMRSDRPFSGRTVQYTYGPDGKLLRTEDAHQLFPGATVDARLMVPIVTDFEYAPNGLLLRKSDNRSNGKRATYEVKYTYF